MRRGLASAALVACAGAVVALAVHFSARLPDGPVAVDWDGVACAHCGMLVSDPAFAAQLQLEDGSVRNYDDPGCLLRDLADPGLPPVHATWLHHHREDRWLPLEHSAFERVDHSPMGYGLAAVAAGELAGAIPLDAARRLVRAEGDSARSSSRVAR